MKVKKLYVLMLLLVVALFLTACNSQEEPKSSEEQTKTEEKAEEKVETTEKKEESEAKEETELLVYSGAGLKNPMEKIKEEFEKENGISLNLIYAGSGQLLAQLEQSGKGDVFIVGSKPTYDAAVEKNLANEGVAVAHHTPVIVTAKGNPLGIQGLEDLTKEGLRLALGEAESNAIGKTSVKMFEKSGIEDYKKNVVVETATVNELYQAMKSGNADAAIVTNDSAFGKEDLEIVRISDDQIIDQIITAGTLKTSEQSEIAEKFIEFLTSDFGRTAFEETGFKPVAE